MLENTHLYDPLQASPVLVSTSTLPSSFLVGHLRHLSLIYLYLYLFHSFKVKVSQLFLHSFAYITRYHNKPLDSSNFLCYLLGRINPNSS